MDVSIIIVNYNTKDLTLNCIRSIYASETGYSFEVIMVDNASTDGSVDTIKELFPEVRIIENSQNLGFAKANNQAANIASGRYLYILNSDTEIEKDVIAKVISYGDSNQEAGVIGTKVVLADGKVQENYYKFPTFLSEVVFFVLGIIKSSDFILFRLNKYKSGLSNRPFEVDVITGCSMFVKRQLYEKTGLFDEKFFMYYEDSEFCYRVKKSGFKCFLFPDGVIKHFHMGSAKKKDENDFKILVECFKGACIYFKHTRSGFYSSVFKVTCFFIWFNELMILKLFTLNKSDGKVMRKIIMLRALLNR